MRTCLRGLLSRSFAAFFVQVLHILSGSSHDSASAILVIGHFGQDLCDHLGESSNRPVQVRPTENQFGRGLIHKTRVSVERHCAPSYTVYTEGKPPGHT